MPELYIGNEALSVDLARTGRSGASSGRGVARERPRVDSSRRRRSTLGALHLTFTDDIMPTRHASATWEGGLRGGTGSYSGESGTLGGTYAFATRFGEEKGSNPEELLAAAEAACYSMALSAQLEGRGHPPTRVTTSAACTVEKVNDAFTVTTMKLTVRAVVPGISSDDFQAVAAATKDSCPISKAIKGNVQIHVDAALE